MKNTFILGSIGKVAWIIVIVVGNCTAEWDATGILGYISSYSQDPMMEFLNRRKYISYREDNGLSREHSFLTVLWYAVISLTGQIMHEVLRGLKEPPILSDEYHGPAPEVVQVIAS